MFTLLFTFLFSSRLVFHFKLFTVALVNKYNIKKKKKLEILLVALAVFGKLHKIEV